MDPKSVVCPGCGNRIEPIYIFDRSPATKKPYLIVRCPRERCGFNIDIEDYTGPRKKHPENPQGDKGNGKDGGKSFWRYGL
jgi:hypothetical protein